MSRVPFLHSVAQDLVLRYGREGIGDGVVFLPTVRAYQHLGSHLQACLGGSVSLPQQYSVQDFLERLSGLETVEESRLMVPLHGFYCRHVLDDEPTSTVLEPVDELGGASGLHALSRSLEDFYYWGSVMIRDFDQIDHYRVDPDRLFVNVVDIKELEQHYDFLEPEHRAILSRFFAYFETQDGETVDVLRERYLRVWRALPRIYTDLHAYMAEAGMGYGGFVSRMALEDPAIGADRLDALLGGASWMAVIGFNTLTGCERELFDRLRERFGANSHFYWKRSPWIEREGTLSGTFIRRHVRRYGDALSGTENDEGAGPVPVRAVSVPYVIAQTNALYHELEFLRREYGAQPGEIAVILNDESLLLPVIDALPGWAEQVNVGMGYPLRDSAVFMLVGQYVDLLSTHRVSDSSVDGEALRLLLNHPFVGAVESSSQELRGLLGRADRRYRVDELSGLVTFYPVIRAGLGEGIFGAILSLLGLVYSHLEEIESSSEDGEGSRSASAMLGHLPVFLVREFVLTAYQTVRGLERSFALGGLLASVPLIRRLLPLALRDVRAAIPGDSLEDLQLIGFLETVTLDYKYAILLSVNDRFLPHGGGIAPSFILPELGYAAGLPRPRDRSAVFAYAFETLLQGCDHVSLIYVDNPNLIGGEGEMSRYLHRMEIEPERYSLSRVAYSLGVGPSEGAIRVGKGDPLVRGWLRRLTDASVADRYHLSPKSINTFLTCPFRFYLEYVLEIGVPEEEEGIGLSALEVGNILHRTLQELFRGCVGRQPSPADYAAMRTRLSEGLVQEVFRDQRLEAQRSAGFSMAKSVDTVSASPFEALLLDQLVDIVERTLTLDEERVTRHGLKVHALEESLIDEFDLRDGRSVIIKGVADRIDQDPEGNLYIVDYKSGRFSEDKYTVSTVLDLFDPEKEGHEYVTQIFLYSYLLSASAVPSAQGAGRIVPQVWLLEATGRDYVPSVRLGKGADAKPVGSFTHLAFEFERGLREALIRMSDLEGSFSPSPRPNSCVYCPHGSICSMGGVPMSS